MSRLSPIVTRLIVLPLAVALSCGLSLCGCGSMDSFRNDVRSARSRRVQQWQAEQAGGERERILLNGSITLTEAVLLGLQNNRAIQQSLQDRIKADARIREAYADALPTVTLGANYTRTDRDLVVGGQKNLNKNNYALTTEVRQPIWRGGSISAGIRAAKLYSLLTDAQARSTAQEVIYDVRRAYLDACLAHELEQASAQSVETAARQLADVKQDRQVGLASDFDVLRAQVQLKNFQADQVKARNRYHLAVTSLLNLLNVSQESDITVGDPLRYRSFTPTMAEAVEAAFVNHPDLEVNEYDLRLRREAVAVEKAGYYPDFDALFTLNHARPHPYKTDRRNTFGTAWAAGLSLSYPIFEGFRTVARVTQAQVDLRKSEIQLRDAEERILFEIRQALLSLRDAAEFVESQQANVEQAEEALRLVRLGRRQGIRKELEVLDAQTALDQARANYYEAVYGHAIARLSYDRATGSLEPPTGAENAQQPSK